MVLLSSAREKHTTAVGEPNPDAVDYYSRIGVSPDADAETIERRRKQADRRFSPMSSSPQGDEQRHMRINVASNVLEDAESRRRYDAFYDAFGPIEGTAVYDTVDESVADAVIDDGTLFAHLRGFVDVLGPIDGARSFETYYEELDPPITTEKLSVDALPNGYATDDAGFGVAAWSFHAAGQPCALSLWLTGGRDLWRSALQDPDDVADLVADLDRDREPSAAPTTSVADSAVEDSPVTDLDATTDIDGHPSSGAPSSDLPSEYTPAGQRTDDTGPGVAERLDEMGLPAPLQRLGDALSYVGTTGGWSLASAGSVSLTGVLSLPVSTILLVPLLAVLLLVRTSLPGVNEAVVGALGVPVASTDAPLTTASLVHYLGAGLVVAVPASLTARFVVPAVRARKTRGLPRDAWLVFGIGLGALAAALFVGLGRGALPRPLAVGTTALLTVFTFQASMDVGSPMLLSRLCRGVATGAFALASGLAALAAALVGLDAAAPGIGTATTDVLGTVPGVASPVLSLGTAEVATIAFGALAIVPLSLATLYTLAYTVESITIRLRSRSYGG
jgi:hypothetical protein